jgi:hypothetical protein
LEKIGVDQQDRMPSGPANSRNLTHLGSAATPGTTTVSRVAAAWQHGPIIDDEHAVHRLAITLVETGRRGIAKHRRIVVQRVDAGDHAVDRLVFHRAAEKFQHAGERTTLSDSLEGDLSGLVTAALRSRSVRSRIRRVHSACSFEMFRLYTHR